MDPCWRLNVSARQDFALVFTLSGKSTLDVEAVCICTCKTNLDYGLSTDGSRGGLHIHDEPSLSVLVVSQRRDGLPNSNKLRHARSGTEGARTAKVQIRLSLSSAPLLFRFRLLTFIRLIPFITLHWLTRPRFTCISINPVRIRAICPRQRPLPLTTRQIQIFQPSLRSYPRHRAIRIFSHDCHLFPFLSLFQPTTVDPLRP
jgi:hypothetical protein